MGARSSRLWCALQCVGVYVNGRVEIIANDQGNRITPSVVAFSDGDRLIGEAAKNQAALNPTNTVYDAKRLIGRKYTDSTVQKDKRLLPFEIVDKDTKPYIEVEVKGERKTFAPEEISAMVLTKMKETSEAFLGREVKNAVVTVPGTSSSDLPCHSGAILTLLRVLCIAQRTSTTPSVKPPKMLA
jgi:heat shock protein 5